MTDTLKPCPFCGEGDPLIHHIEPHSHPISGLPDFEGSITIECRGCDLGFIKPTEAEAVAQWNRRADSEQAKDAEIIAAAENLVAVKGRYHSQQAYERLELAIAASKSNPDGEIDADQN